jgi:maltose-binding protein MalE
VRIVRRLSPIATFAIAAAIAVTVAGCGGGGSASSTAGSGSEAGTTITYWASDQGSSIADDYTVLNPQLQKFTSQTGIKVKLEVIGWPDLLNRILARPHLARGPTSSTSATPGRPRSRPPAHSCRGAARTSPPSVARTGSCPRH